MNFGMIFVCLLIGAVVGFEFGKYIESRKIKEAMKCLSDGMKEAAEELQKLAEKQKANAQKHTMPKTYYPATGGIVANILNEDMEKTQRKDEEEIRDGERA